MFQALCATSRDPVRPRIKKEPVVLYAFTLLATIQRTTRTDVASCKDMPKTGILKNSDIFPLSPSLTLPLPEIERSTRIEHTAFSTTHDPTNSHEGREGSE